MWVKYRMNKRFLEIEQMETAVKTVNRLSPEALRSEPKRFEAVFGVNVGEFDKIVEHCKLALYEQLRREIVLWETERIAKLHKRMIVIMERDVAITLLYQRHYITQEVLGASFGMKQGSICTIIRRTEHLLEATLPTGSRISEALSDVVEEMPVESFEVMNLGFIIDGVEQQTQRPKDSVAQRERYSGKKKAMLSRPR